MGCWGRGFLCNAMVVSDLRLKTSVGGGYVCIWECKGGKGGRGEGGKVEIEGLEVCMGGWMEGCMDGWVRRV